MKPFNRSYNEGYRGYKYIVESDFVDYYVEKNEADALQELARYAQCLLSKLIPLNKNETWLTADNSSTRG